MNRSSFLIIIREGSLKSSVTAMKQSCLQPVSSTSEVILAGFKTNADDSFRHFGQEIIANKIQLPIDDPKVNVLWLKLYRVRENEILFIENNFILF